MPPDPAREPTEIEQVAQEVAREAHVDLESLRPEEKAYLKEHVLKKPMGVLHIWALGVGVVITGEYFGWNPGLKEGGPIGMLLASLFVCALYMAWVLCLSELSVAMPFAGGPLAYGRRLHFFCHQSASDRLGRDDWPAHNHVGRPGDGLDLRHRAMGRRSPASQDHGVDDLWRHCRIGVVLAGVHSGRPAGPHLDRAAAAYGLARRHQGNSLCHLVAGDD